MNNNENQAWVEDTIGKIREKMCWVSIKNKDKIPYCTGADGNYDDRCDDTGTWALDNGINWWTNGFWGGMMWLMYQDTRIDRYMDIARSCEKKLEKCFDIFYGLHHDVGFMFLPTAVMDYRLTGRCESRKTALHAANLLAGRFNPAGRFIRAWNEVDNSDTTGWAIIDCMMNISLLYWASEETGDPRFRQIAIMHSDTVEQYFVRPDGSVNHIVEFDPETGAMVRTYGGQGYTEGSAWSRGQGWALYGFACGYKHTGKIEYLNTAKQVAHYCMANISENGHIPVDFRQPLKPGLEDSCGACVIACGLMELAGHVPELEQGMYKRAAETILKALLKDRCDWSRDNDAIIRNCTGAYHDEGSRHMTMNYADFYFMEAIYKYKKDIISVW